MEKMLGAQTKYRELYILRLFEISFEQDVRTFFVIFSHPLHPTLASLPN